MSTPKETADYLREHDAIVEALREYHHALDTRQHGGDAANRFVREVEDVLRTPWVQGATLKKPTATTSQPVKP